VTGATASPRLVLDSPTSGAINVKKTTNTLVSAHRTHLDEGKRGVLQWTENERERSTIMPKNPSREATLFCRYILSSLDRLAQCLDGLDENQLNWQPPAPHTNSLYTLVVHTLGNAEENLLLTLFDQPSQRNREQEFVTKGQSADVLITQWHALRERLQKALLSLSSDDLEREHLHPRRGSITELDILIVVARHAAEHLGQAELTRDLVLASTPR